MTWNVQPVSENIPRYKTSEVKKLSLNSVITILLDFVKLWLFSKSGCL